MDFKGERGIGRCGRGCVFCEREGMEDCGGCENKLRSGQSCQTAECSLKNGAAGCFECGDYPCGKPFPQLENRKNKAFLRFLHEFGESVLIRRLKINRENGVKSGEYDAARSELDVYRLLRFGRIVSDKSAEDEATRAGDRIIVKPLEPGLTRDYLDFFNYRAFTDNPPWGGCCCTGFQTTKDEEKTLLWDRAKEYGGDPPAFMRALRDEVRRQIDTGALRGYLAYLDGFSIGWCKSNDRASYPVEASNGARLYAPAEKREKAVACFEIAPDYRGRGVASALLSRVISDAAAEGYRAVVGFPVVHEEGK